MSNLSARGKSIVDGMLLGGASVIAFLVIRVTDPDTRTHLYISWAMLALANLVNHPHFAHSYQMFAESWKNVDALDAKSKARWINAGIVTPTVLAAFLVFSAWQWSLGEAIYIAISISAMGALVGWHYVKQGFGIAMFDAAQKRTWWPPHTRKSLLINSYVCWFTAWALINGAPRSGSFWGLFGLELRIPSPLILALSIVCTASTIKCALDIKRTVAIWLENGKSYSEIPWNGLIAYTTTLYLWTIFFFVDPSFALMIPFFHSLQYLTIVWKYKVNRLSSESSKSVKLQIITFSGYGILLGAAGFWIIPGLLDYLRTGFIINLKTPAIAIACFWLFINIHHYVIDNSLWKHDNPDMKKYLFNQRISDNT